MYIYIIVCTIMGRLAHGRSSRLRGMVGNCARAFDVLAVAAGHRHDSRGDGGATFCAVTYFPGAQSPAEDRGMAGLRDPHPYAGLRRARWAGA